MVFAIISLASVIVWYLFERLHQVRYLGFGHTRNNRSISLCSLASRHQKVSSRDHPRSHTICFYTGLEYICPLKTIFQTSSSSLKTTATVSRSSTILQSSEGILSSSSKKLLALSITTLFDNLSSSYLRVGHV